MNKNRPFLIIQSTLYVLLMAALAGATIQLYLTGLAEKAVDPLSWIFTRENVGAILLGFPVLPLFILCLGMTVACLALGIKDEKGEKPVRLVTAATYRPSTAPNPARLTLVRRVTFALALVFIVVGVFNGSALDVFGKAIKICTECVGLG